MPDFTKNHLKTGSLLSHKLPQPTNPAFRAIGMTFEAKDFRQWGNALQGVRDQLNFK